MLSDLGWRFTSFSLREAFRKVKMSRTSNAAKKSKEMKSKKLSFGLSHIEVFDDFNEGYFRRRMGLAEDVDESVGDEEWKLQVEATY